ncbi:DUF4112 domain-containing protein [Thalassorhabdomicrobium marinisediminis]|uniref:DUF4112 domain-containing protein n=1 Tax=Thalassorhabdomicrobium marinisediminis TaxID=2170577 RepID=UPI002490741E|nr:DUF4112 domain-containing protein [Thalassorhabdomicrobium marinisediminis]
MAAPDLAHLDRLSSMLDSRFRLPGTKMRFGWDTIVGLVPGVGDAVMLVPAGYLMFQAYRLGARKRTLARMALNTGVDTTVGAIPLLGDLFDMAFKSNNRNVAILRKEIERRGAAPAPTRR